MLLLALHFTKTARDETIGVLRMATEVEQWTRATDLQLDEIMAAGDKSVAVANVIKAELTFLRNLKTLLEAIYLNKNCTLSALSKNKPYYRLLWFSVRRLSVGELIYVTYYVILCICLNPMISWFPTASIPTIWTEAMPGIRSRGLWRSGVGRTCKTC